MRAPPSEHWAERARFQVDMIDPPSTTRRHPAIAAFLSFLFPGLGQAYRGERRLALLLAVPVLVLLLAAALAVAVGGNAALNSAFSAGFLTALIALDLALMAWRLFAIGEAGLKSPGPEHATEAVTATGPSSTGRQPMTAERIGTIAIVVMLMLLTVGMHAWAGMVIGRVNTTLGDVFSGVGGGPPGGRGGNPPPLNHPDYAWNGTERINFLLLGIDSAPRRGDEALTDTILVVSVDPTSKSAVMISIPRDTGFLPLPDRSVYADGLYPNKVNELTTEAGANPELWCPDMTPDQGAACGLRTLERTVGLYLGIPIQYYATVDLLGFQHLIDAVGPLTLCLPGKLVDDTYHEPWDAFGPRRGVELPAGCTEYDGPHALAYARARKGYIEMPDGTQVQQDDFKRADRQQEVLLKLREQFAEMDLIFDLPDALEAIGATVKTDFPRDQAGDLASLLPLITGPDIRRLVLDLPRFVDPPPDPLANYVLVPRRDDLRVQMRRLFGRENLEGWYLATRNTGPDV
jgi:LCP family protein required for cell wall assembly